MTTEKEKKAVDYINKLLDDKELSTQDKQLRLRKKGYKPGQVIAGTMWIPWIKEDLDPNDTVTFVAQDVLGTQGGVQYGDNGKKGFIIDLNGLTCFIRVHELNTINRFFYSRYEAMVSDGIKLEEFKRGGPAAPMMWDQWQYIPFASSFGMDMDGRFLRDPKYYELDEFGIPVKLNNIPLLMQLYFEGALDIEVTKLQFAQLVWMIFKAQVKGKINKLLGRKNDNQKQQQRRADGRGNKSK